MENRFKNLPRNILFHGIHYNFFEEDEKLANYSIKDDYDDESKSRQTSWLDLYALMMACKFTTLNVTIKIPYDKNLGCSVDVSYKHGIDECPDIPLTNSHIGLTEFQKRLFLKFAGNATLTLDRYLLRNDPNVFSAITHGASENLNFIRDNFQNEIAIPGRTLVLSVKSLGASFNGKIKLPTMKKEEHRIYEYVGASAYTVTHEEQKYTP